MGVVEVTLGAMSEDPDYLSSKGELATLKSAVACYFHQDMQLEFKGPKEAWAACAVGHGGRERTVLLHQIERLMTRTDEEILRFWRDWAVWGAFSDGASVREHLMGGVKALTPLASSANDA